MIHLPRSFPSRIFMFPQMLICVKSRINELELQTLPDTRELVSINFDKPADNEPTDQDSGKIKIVAKMFLNDFSEDSVDEGLDHLLKSCSTTPTVILAYHPTFRTDSEKFIWADNNMKSKANFKFMWKKLRAAKQAGQIAQLGIADMDLDTILDIFEDQKFDFTILQINTQTCCVVPPELQQFCKDHEIQLLTHSDPQGKHYKTEPGQTLIETIFSDFSIDIAQRDQPARLQNEMDRTLPRNARLSRDSHQKGFHRLFQEGSQLNPRISSGSTALYLAIVTYLIAQVFSLMTCKIIFLDRRILEPVTSLEFNNRCTVTGAQTHTTIINSPSVPNRKQLTFRGKFSSR